MRQIEVGAALLILLSAHSAGATPATAATNDFDTLDEKTCAAFRRDAVPQSINTAEFIDAHIEPVSAAEEVYLSAEISAFKLSPNPSRFSLLASRPSFSAWRLHTSLKSLVQSLKAIDVVPPGESLEAHRAKSATFALLAVEQTTAMFDAYARYDSARIPPFMTEATVETASVSLANMGPALALFVSCTVDAIKK
ncbi:hypothetical protein P0D88_44850 [Paraburkholderia sp. RL18-103-BIB-C]|jgi:hypothetical protein|uniref:hypothetical protein n=1 Tax=unclassified Paraburkholderia TaxID=2615204 RepID=UPI0038BC3D05